MSLNPKKIKTKHIDIEGTQKDFDAIADVIRQAADKVNIDIVPKDLDIPGRILIRPEHNKDATHWEYPKLQKALREFAEGLTEPGDAVVDFGKLRITEKPEVLIMDSPTLRKMNQNSVGINMGIGDIFKEDIISDMEVMLAETHQTARKNPLTNANPLWVYASDLVGNKGNAPLGTIVKNVDVLEKIKEYPPDLGGIHNWSGDMKDKYNQAYFVILRVDKTFPPSMPLSTKSGQWDKWIKDRPVPEMMSLYKGNPPKTFGDLLERFAVYSTARTFGMRGAFLAPVHAWDNARHRVGSTRQDYSDKMISEVIKSESGVKSISTYPTYMAFVVVGKGPTRTVDLGKETVQNASELPGWD